MSQQHIDFADKTHGYKGRIILALIEKYPAKKYEEIAEIFKEKTGETITVHSIAKIRHKARTREEANGDGVDQPAAPPAVAHAATPPRPAPPTLALPHARIPPDRFTNFLAVVQQTGLHRETLEGIVEKITPLIKIAGSWDNLVRFIDLSRQFDLPTTAPQNG